MLPQFPKHTTFSSTLESYPRLFALPHKTPTSNNFSVFSTYFDSRFQILCNHNLIANKSKMKMRENKGTAKGGGGGNSSRSGLELNGKPLDFRSIMKEVELLGSSDMTWKERKDLQNKKVVSLGGKAPKKQRLPLSVAKPMMKNQKKREDKMLQEELLLGHCGENMIKRAKKQEEKRKPDSILKSSEGRFRNGVLDVKHLLRSAPPPKDDDDHGPPMASKGKKNKGGGKKKKGSNPGKRKGGKKRH